MHAKLEQAAILVIE